MVEISLCILVFMKSKQTKYRPRGPHSSRKMAEAKFLHEGKDYYIYLSLHVYKICYYKYINIKNVYANFSDTRTISFIDIMYLAPRDTHGFDLWSSDFNDFFL